MNLCVISGMPYNVNTATASICNHAYIIYRSGVSGKKGAVYYNKDASQVLSFSLRPSKEKIDSHRNISSFCMKWRKVLDKRIFEMKKSGKRYKSEIYFINLLRSGRRRYIVKGLILSGQRTSSEIQEIHYLFILDRVKPDTFNIPMIIRAWNLSKREQDLVQLTFSDLSNKEIANHLGLSLNTVKSYMKFLMRKLNVTSRAGIISRLLVKEEVS